MTGVRMAIGMVSEMRLVLMRLTMTAQVTPMRASIAAVGIDRSGAYRAAVEAHLPDADIVFDKFHLISNLGEVIDKVRRRTQAQTDAEGRACGRCDACRLRAEGFVKAGAPDTTRYQPR